MPNKLRTFIRIIFGMVKYGALDGCIAGALFGLVIMVGYAAIGLFNWRSIVYVGSAVVFGFFGAAVGGWWGLIGGIFLGFVQGIVLGAITLNYFGKDCNNPTVLRFMLARCAVVLCLGIGIAGAYLLPAIRLINFPNFGVTLLFWIVLCLIAAETSRRAATKVALDYLKR